ncbi:hypothetical protein [Dyadobacter diqingensis]|uniref:hypothetical protein n=1 Tax=Dyadobacter diqingensis TaxID=2938121 RepID=UPI0020C42696|nr:hypothetical protein [Dyadobacter diqingensis]
MNELFVEMVGRIHKDPSIYLNGPGPEKERQDKQKLSGKDTPRLVVAVSDLISPPDKMDIPDILNFCKKEGVKVTLPAPSRSYKIKLQLFRDNPRYHFRYLSEFPEKGNFVKPDGTFAYDGGIAFSRIQFDKGKQIGILTGTYVCEPQMRHRLSDHHSPLRRSLEN